MADLRQFRPKIVTNMPPATERFFSAFSGNITITTIKDRAINSYINPTTDEYKQIQQNNILGHNVYFTVNETTEIGRKASDIKKIRAIFCDSDSPRAEPKDDWPLPPSIIVKTSSHGLSGNKYHFYWLTTTSNVDEWERVEAGLVKFYEMDVNVKDIARILRVPGYKHCKTEPYTDCTLHSMGGQVYEWDTIVKAFPPIAKAQVHEAQGKDPDGEYNEHVLCERFRNPVIDGHISNSLNSIIMHMANDGRSPSRIKRHVEQLYETVDEDTLHEHRDRYYQARIQVDKWIKSAKGTVNKRRALEEPSPVVQLHPDVPESLDWDWSILKSNPIPEDAIPQTMLDAAKEIGDWTSVGQDPAILTAVFITSALLSKNILIHEIGDDLTTHCQSGICIVMDTGARKSSIYNQMNKPFFEFEERLRQEWEDTRYITDSKAKALDSEISAMDKAYAKISSPGDGERETYAIQRGQKLLDKSKLQLKQPWLRSSDVTEEKLVRKLDDNKGCIAVISDDARQVINNITGKYGKEGSTGESVYINALTGSAILYERVGNEMEIAIDHPVLNALLFVQPDAALRLRNSDMFVPSGLAARLPMYFYPVSGSDIVKNTKRRKVDSDKMEPYYTALRNICVQRMDNPLHIRMDEPAMETCAKMDQKFAKLLEGKWKGHYDKSNKLITLSIMYATCFAALEDPQFAMSFRDVHISDNTYTLSSKYLNMGFMFADALFGQSITSHQVIVFESLPRKAVSLLSTLQKWYAEGKVIEGFVLCGSFNNSISPPLREFLPDILDMLLKKKWLYTTVMQDDRRKLNGGFPDKYVDTGDLIYHLNIEGIKKREDMGLEVLEKGLVGL